MRLTTADERLRSRKAVLARGAHPGTDVWVFAYGSLMWNPAFHYAEERAAIVHGYHRRFCLVANFGRGSRARPGLLLGLARGGTCRGTAFRIAAAQVEEELDIIWAREKVADGYQPIWVRIKTESGTIPAIAFAIDESLPTYAGRMSQEEVARRIAAASGSLGHCADYLEDTVAHLEERGVYDRALTAIRKRVRELRRAA